MKICSLQIIQKKTKFSRKKPGESGTYIQVIMI